MGVIAVDVALIPEDIIDLCAVITKDSEIPLGKEDYVPHVSLFLGCVHEENIPEIKEKIAQITPVSICITGTYCKKDQYHFTVKRTQELQKLHEEICTLIKPFCENEVTKEMLVEGEKTDLSETSKEVLSSFYELYAYAKYFPHITLRVEQKPLVHYPLKSKTKIKIFQVGNGCTCRREL